MKSEYDLFKEGEVPKSYIEAHVALLHFINKAWEDNVYINTRIAVFAGISSKSNMYLEVSGSAFPMVDIGEIEQFIAGQHKENRFTTVRNENNDIKDIPLKVIRVSDEAFEEILRECKLGCDQLSPLLYLFKKYADEFHVFETRHESRAEITVFAKLKDIWFSNIGTPWGYRIR